MNRTDALFPSLLENTKINQVVWFVMLAVMGSLVIAISSKIKVPMWPVDMSLQTLAIFTIAAVFGLKLGLATILLYLAEGALGFPVFQGTPERGIGLAYMVGPTGGYLVGFVVMTAITGWAADQGWWRNPFKIGAAMLAGEVILLALGAFWLMYLFGVSQGIEYGIGPFIVPDMLKLALAAGIVSILGNTVRKRLG
ncbi:biotin transporter BioY [Sulfitobacter sp. R86518]|uniref:biotin transporter BioY n=1 Tax=Sulfitobacter sp. R86518 TaxID=3093858 RepID=UPI0036D84E1D|tara:strand:+ start:1689 stop:2276 length:588 start_codon:yes stop_codon:yes gene_type:complete